LTATSDLLLHLGYFFFITTPCSIRGPPRSHVYGSIVGRLPLSSVTVTSSSATSSTVLLHRRHHHRTSRRPPPVVAVRICRWPSLMVISRRHSSSAGVTVLRTTRLVRPFAWRFPPDDCLDLILLLFYRLSRFVQNTLKNWIIYYIISFIRPPLVILSFIIIIAQYCYNSRWSLRVSAYRTFVSLSFAPPHTHTHTYTHTRSLTRSSCPPFGRRLEITTVRRQHASGRRVIRGRKLETGHGHQDQTYRRWAIDDYFLLKILSHEMI